MTTYAERIDRLLAGPRGLTSGIGSIVPSVGFTEASTPLGFVQASIPYILWLLVIVFVIMLILTIVHYTITPIFNFGNQPNAPINLSQFNDWEKNWDNKDVKLLNEPTKTKLPAVNYSFVVDVRVDKQVPELSTSNIYVLTYKSTGAALENFEFLSPSISPPNNNNPSLVLAYDALQSKVMVIFFVTSTNQSYVKTISSEIIPEKPYRIGVVVSSSIVELYVNGKYASSTTFPGLTMSGTNNDLMFSVPPVYASKVTVKNLFKINRVASSGEIRSLGGPALT